MRLVRIVLSDLHLGTGSRRGELNPLEDFPHDERFAELLAHYDREVGDRGDVELILNGDIFDLLKVKVNGAWPTEITQEIAAEKLRQCLEGHPRFVQALRDFLVNPKRRLTYLPGNHDLDLWFSGPQDLLRRYIAPGAAAERVQFITSSDTYYLPEGIQIRHGHQFERIHRVDYARMTQTLRDGRVVLAIPWGSKWILEVLNRAKEERHYVDRVQPFGRFLFGGLIFDTWWSIVFMARTSLHFLKHRVFTIRAWRERIQGLFSRLRDEVIALGDFDDTATAALQRIRGVHTLIVGHSHAPRFRALPGGKTLINSGTWQKMINLDLRFLGQDSGLTYVVVEYTEEGQPRASLMRWRGTLPPCEVIPYAD